MKSIVQEAIEKSSFSHLFLRSVDQVGPNTWRVAFAWSLPAIVFNNRIELELPSSMSREEKVKRWMEAIAANREAWLRQSDPERRPHQ